MDDASVITRVRSGDREAFRVLVERYQSALLALLRSLMPGIHDREDAAQESFLAAFDNLDRFDETRGSFRAWLFRIARNRALNELKRRRPEPHPAAVESAASAGRPADRGDFPELDRALASLPTALRSAFVLAEIHGLTYEEVALIEQAPLGTVKSRIHRARERLRAALARVEGRR
ncbi:MAG: sigma-70 family RNA polymerase sigma factor [Planctomycetota bacterium]|jgi:RNA polymerase sigma-70 factor (ECF subfamily)